MKKFIVAFILVAALIVAVIVYLTKHATHATRVGALLPAETVLFIHVPDIARTLERWPKTALAQIGNEPEVQAFLEKPKSNIPQNPEVDHRLDQIKRIDFREAFFAVTSVPENGAPKILAGFSFRGSKDEMDQLFTDARNGAQRAWPSGKSDIVRDGQIEIETFTYNYFSVAWTQRGDWVFITDDLDLLKTTLDRFDEKSTRETQTSLRDNDHFRATLARMPMDFDVLTFIETRSLVDRLANFIAAANPTAGAMQKQQFDEMRKIEAVAATTKLDGENLRDVMFVLKSGMEKHESLRRDSLAVSSTNTLIYNAAVMQRPANFQMPDASLDTTGIFKALQGLLQTFAAQGLSADDFWKTFGPENGVAIDWPAQAATPSLVAALDVRDAAKAGQFADALARARLGGDWTQESIDGATFYRLPQTMLGMVPLGVTIAVTDKFLLAGLTFDSVHAAVLRVKNGGGNDTLSKNGAYEKASSLVREPNAAFLFVDSRALFERLYGMLRPMAMMWLTFAPQANSYIDANKLPATETISKHLGPIVFSQSALDDGVLSESVGPITFSQAAVGIGFGAGAAAVVPMLRQQMNGGKPGAVSTAPTFPAMPPAATSGSNAMGAWQAAHRKYLVPATPSAATSSPAIP